MGEGYKEKYLKIYKNQALLGFFLLPLSLWERLSEGLLWIF